MSLEEEEMAADQDEYTDFVPAFLARSAEEAEGYRQLLDDHDIPAIVGTDEDVDEKGSEFEGVRRSGMTHGVPVLVPDVLLDEASEVIADREKIDDLDEDDPGDDQDDEFGFSEAANGDGTESLDDEDENRFGDEDDLGEKFG